MTFGLYIVTLMRLMGWIKIDCQYGGLNYLKLGKSKSKGSGASEGFPFEGQGLVESNDCKLGGKIEGIICPKETPTPK